MPVTSTIITTPPHGRAGCRSLICNRSVACSAAPAGQCDAGLAQGGSCLGERNPALAVDFSCGPVGADKRFSAGRLDEASQFFSSNCGAGALRIASWLALGGLDDIDR